MKKLRIACLIVTIVSLAALAFAATGNPSTAPAVNGKDFIPAPELRIPINGCEAIVQCQRGTSPSSVLCIGHTPTGCIAAQSATPPWVSCDGVVHSCNGLQ
jgi:hypothetical protein